MARAPRPAEADFAEYIRARRDHLVRAAYLLTGDLHQAEDLVQTVLVRVWPRWPKIKEMENVDAYVHRTLISLFSTSVRRRRWREVSADPQQDGTWTTPTAPDQTMAVEARADLRTALGSLAPRQRAVLVLRYYLDLPEAEAADILACSVGTVKSQAAKAVKRLRERQTNNALTDERGTT
ncbi:SigE family RNA polymerase sigma factor [Actinacidiphila oryziradicis]|uniref:SigE family RNA polymerase sigma factor n=1 Tax=Actinacidiphila oryziradicis TaxID=2571141 RepID=A0A4U0S1K5_9ACTN|nr:SigE family RNA polymerase sigma factor [Actinacidiphila oryziradicis]TKA01998.1 SigE family RNA polymerase sigma factor [Actinacidiphila oryziradicis]